MSTLVITKPEAIGFNREMYLNRLLAQCEGQELAIKAEWLQQLRQRGAAFVSESTLPSKRDEGWRFTDLSELYQIDFQLANKATVPAAAWQPFVLPEASHSRLAFVNGIYAPELSDLSGLPEGIDIGNLNSLSGSQNVQVVKYLGQQTNGDVFTALNAAGLRDVAVIWTSRNAVIETPIHLLFLTVPGATPIFSQPRVLVVAEANSSLNFVEYYSAISEYCPDVQQNRPYFTNAVTEIWVGENAQVNHSRIQRESRDGFHIGKTAIAQSQDSRYTCNEISLGGKLYRHNLEIVQQGEQTETYLNGLAVVGGKQVTDTHSDVFLRKPYGTVNQLHKCIIDDSAHAIFSGKISVPKAAQLTNAAQLNRNLLLSPKARVNTKPELQITADNVKCSHGATISQLEADELFYLRSRGLTEVDARHLLIDAFAADILERLPFKSLHHQLTQCVACRTI
jgi:Fe-S cluster assembly protein SufD